MMAKCPWAPKDMGLSPETYWKLADQFNPQQYDPEKWLQAAKDAGFGYAVLTTKHHNGYALWPSKFGDFSMEPVPPHCFPGEDTSCLLAARTSLIRQAT